SADLRYNYALLAERFGDYLFAIDEYERVLEIDPRHARTLNNLGRIYLRAQEPRKALEHLDRCVAIDPQLAEAHLNRALALLALDRPAEAASALRRALERLPEGDPDRAAAQRLLAEIEEHKP
ncbi:MAG: tetratricopeptide repeat protein, partial [Planctomycetota bacterium]